MEQMIWFESIISFVNIQIILIYLLKGKIKKAITFILTLFFLIPFALLTLYFHNKNTDIELVFCFLCFLMCFIIPFFSNIGVDKKTILYISFFYIGLSISLIASVRWIALAFQASQITFTVIDVFINLLLSILILIISKSQKFNNFSMYSFITTRIKILLMCCVWLSALLTNFISKLFLSYPSTLELVVIEVMTALLIIMLGIMCPLLVANNTFKTYYYTVSSSMENQINAQIKHYELLVETNKDIRRFKHDFDNLKIGLKKLLADGDINEALKYLDDCHSIKTEYIKFETGNRIADALLTEKSKVAKSNNIDIIFEGIIPPKLSAIDICVIFGNALDNAIEECSKTEKQNKKSIKISANMENRFLFIYIKNPVSEKINVYNNHIKTTKTNKQQHGIGLNSIRQAVDKYDGTVDISINDNIFTIRIVLDFNNL